VSGPELDVLVLAFLEEKFGDLQQVTPLRGVVRPDSTKLLEFAKGRAILKQVEPAERDFYIRFAPKVRERGVPIPDPIAMFVGPDSERAATIVLEYAGDPLPRERWLADPHVMSALRRLHHVENPVADADPGFVSLAREERTPPEAHRFRPEWTSAMSAAALDRLESGVSLRQDVERCRVAAASLFEPRAWISGDPNPTNWAVRDDGSVVLLDWERFTQAHPAIDLAISVPGLGGEAEFARVAQAYAEAGGVPIPVHEIALAKIWSVIEFLAEQEAPEALRRQVPVWLESAIPIALEKR
jgi:hypothetical protein